MTYRGRYKGVWAQGYEQAMADATDLLRKAVQRGVEFGQTGQAWDRNRISARLRDRPERIVQMDRIIGLEELIRPVGDRHATPPTR